MKQAPQEGQIWRRLSHGGGGGWAGEEDMGRGGDSKFTYEERMGNRRRGTFM